MVFFLIIGLLANIALIYLLHFRVKVSGRICVYVLVTFNFFFVNVIQIGQFVSQPVFMSLLRYSFYLLLFGVFLEVSFRLRFNLTSKSSAERKKLFKYLNIASMESYGPEFLIEEKIYKQSLLREAKEYGHVKSLDNGLAMITIVNGRRLTVGQPHKFERSCFLLGGSTIFNAQVPNNLTIASQMQQLLNSLSQNLIVHNLGLSGATSDNRVRFMRENLTLSPNDVVILYFGVNDICFPGQMNIKDNFGDLIIYTANVLLDICRKNFQIFARLRLFQKPRFRRSTKKYLQEVVIPSIIQGSSFCKAKSANFLAVLQPSLYSIAKSDDEDLEELRKLPKSLKRILDYGNSLFMKELEQYDFFVDGRSVFNNARKQVYCDWIHTTESGNSTLANFFVDELGKRRWIQEKTC